MGDSWFVFVALAGLFFAFGLWYVPCILVFKRPARQHVLDECNNLANSTSGNHKSVAGTPHFRYYYRTGNRSRLVNEYAIVYRDRLDGDVMKLLMDPPKIDNETCRALVACGSIVSHTSMVTGDYPCHLPNQANISRAIGVVVKCGELVDPFFWVEGNNSATKMLHLRGKEFVCSEHARCAFDEIEIGSEFSLDRIECGTRYFFLKGDVPLWLKATKAL